MDNKGKTQGQSIWIGAFIIIGLFLVWLLMKYLPDENKVFVTIAGVIGAYVSLFSLVLMFSQFKSIRDISQETKDKMETMVSLSSMAKHAEMARSAQNDVNSSKDDLAIYKIQIIKETLIKLERNDVTDNAKITEFCGKLGTHLTALRSGRSNIRREIIICDLEDIADFLLRQEETMKEKSN